MKELLLKKSYLLKERSELKFLKEVIMARYKFEQTVNSYAAIDYMG